MTNLLFRDENLLLLRISSKFTATPKTGMFHTIEANTAFIKVITLNVGVLIYLGLP